MARMNTFFVYLITLRRPRFECRDTHHRGKYHYTNDLLFDRFVFDQTSKTACSFNKSKATESIQNKEVSGTVTLSLKLVCSDRDEIN